MAWEPLLSHVWKRSQEAVLSLAIARHIVFGLVQKAGSEMVITYLLKP
jgi:hypothetical protein